MFSSLLSITSWDEFLESLTDFGTNAGIKIAIGILILIVGLIICRVIKGIIRRIFKRTKGDDAVAHFTASLVDILLKLIVLVCALAEMGINTASIITVLGTCGVAIGLALKDSLGNLAAGLIIIFNKTFKKGDYIVCGDVEGFVQTINLFNTVLLTFDNVEVVVPNNILANASVKNNTAMDLRRVDLLFNVALDTDIKAAQDSVFKVIDKNQMVIDEPATTCRIESQTSYYITIVVKAWCKKEDYWDVHYDLIENIRAQFIEDGIVCPLPQVEVKEK